MFPPVAGSLFLRRLMVVLFIQRRQLTISYSRWKEVAVEVRVYYRPDRAREFGLGTFIICSTRWTDEAVK